MATSISKQTQSFSIEVTAYASFTSRVIARLIDMAVVGVFWFAFTQGLNILLKHEHTPENVLSDFMTGIEGTVVIFYCLFYMPLMEFFGGTIGKRIMGIHLLDAGSLQPPDFMNCFGRGMVYMVFCALLGIPAVVGCLAVLTSKKQQAWHDFVSNVVAVKKIKL